MKVSNFRSVKYEIIWNLCIFRFNAFGFVRRKELWSSLKQVKYDIRCQSGLLPMLGLLSAIVSYTVVNHVNNITQFDISSWRSAVRVTCWGGSLTYGVKKGTSVRQQCTFCDLCHVTASVNTRMTQNVSWNWFCLSFLAYLYPSVRFFFTTNKRILKRGFKRLYDISQ